VYQIANTPNNLDILRFCRKKFLFLSKESKMDLLKLGFLFSSKSYLLQMKHKNFRKILLIEESILFKPIILQEKITFFGYNLFYLNPEILEEYLNILRYLRIFNKLITNRVFDIEHYTIRKILENLTKKVTNEKDFQSISRCRMLRNILEKDSDSLFS